MSYISAIRKGDEVLVWERTEAGRDIKIYPAPFYFYVPDKKGEFVSIYGDKLTRFDFSTSREFYQAKSECDSNNVKRFESDIPPELKVLSENYYNVPAPNLNITLLDIEVDYRSELGFASIENPYAPINSVAMYHMWSQRMIVYAVPPENLDVKSLGTTEDMLKRLDEIAPLPDDVQVELVLCKDERELLMYLLSEIEDSDILSGWNSDFFDVPYIGKRLLNLGKKYFRMLSFDMADEPRWREVELMGRQSTTLDLSGRVRLDMMDLFKKYEAALRPSYKLESVAAEILPDLPKLEYEGSLASLYRTDFLWFVRYNLRDTEILKGFEDRLGYIDLANQMCHLSTALFQHVAGTLKLAEYATINYCHHELGGLIVNDLQPPDIDKSIQGAFVLTPKVGMHEWIGSIDINSLYPSSIRSINISKETIVGQFTNDGDDVESIGQESDEILTLVYESGESEQRTAQEWRSFLKESKWAVSGYGTVFDQNKQGVIPAVLEDWYATRKKYQKLKAEHAHDKLKETYYDKLQYVYKIKLNSFYGALSNLYFRFYDLRMGESTTGTGRMILKHQCAKTNEILTGEYDVTGDAIIYGDTDSTYFETFAGNKDEALLIADRVADLVNESFPEFMRETFLCNNGFDDIIKAGREIVSDRGIFVDKKRYILHLIDLDGRPVDKLKVMGLDTKKTTLPTWIATKLNGFIERHLKGEEWDVIKQDIVDFKDYIETTDDIMSIGLPKGVKGVEKYTTDLRVHGEGARLPGHVAASIFYNLCLEKFNDKESVPIYSGMKIKVFYLKKKVNRFKAIAIPVDIEQVPSWFFERFEIDREAHIKRLVDKPLQNILKAIDQQVPSKQSMLADSFLEF
jgi:DNA polymerase elongation subunit (family B)